MCLINFNKGEDDEGVFEILQYSEMECNCVKKITEGCLESTVRYDSIYRGGSRRGRTPLNFFFFFFFSSFQFLMYEMQKKSTNSFALAYIPVASGGFRPLAPLPRGP